MMTLILKGTNGCNLNCSYCSLGEKKIPENVHPDKLIAILDYVCRVVQFRKENMLNVILHGGEPTLVPAATYRKAFQYIEKHYPEISVSVSMQTNAFYFSTEMLQFIKNYNIDIGVSIDGSKEIHDCERKGQNGKGTFDVVVDNINLLRKNQIKVSCLMVLTSVGLNKDFEFIRFYAERGLHLKINPLLNYGEVYKNPELSIEAGDYARYMIGLYEYIVKNNIDVDVSPIDKYVKSAVSKTAITECTYNSSCNKNFLCIDHLGDIYPCGKFSDIKEFSLGNVENATIDLFSTYNMQILLDRRNVCRPSECNICKYVDKCCSGCSAEAAIEGDVYSVPKLCADYKMMFRYFEKQGLIFMKEHLKKKRNSLLMGD